MTLSEQQFVKWMKKERPGLLLVKIPDFKQGVRGVGGLPDYAGVCNYDTDWYEVKSGFGDTLNLKSHFTLSQRVLFKKMFVKGVDVYVACLTKSCGWQIISFSDLLVKGKYDFKRKQTFWLGGFKK